MLFIFLPLFSVTAAFPSGAPADTCRLWTARHGDNQDQTSLPPYQLTFDGNSVTLRGRETLRGFFIQGQDTSTRQPVGKFLASSMGQTRGCSDDGSEDSITHVNSNDKTSVTFKWQAPVSFEGEVQFRAVVVQAYSRFWNNVYSSPATIY